MVLTIDPVSKKHEITMFPILISTVGLFPTYFLTKDEPFVLAPTSRLPVIGFGGLDICF